MRVIECNICGHTLSAANDDELVRALTGHVADQHPDAGLDEDAARKLVAEQAYDASDS
jgi:predicted small metal-binding protein